MDIIKYLHSNLPSRVVYDGKDYEFMFYINHNQYDARMGYITPDDGNGSNWIILIENINDDETFIDAICDCRRKLEKLKLL